MGKLFKTAIVGASGLVGRKMLEVLSEREFPVEELSLFTSEKSAGGETIFRGKTLKFQNIRECDFSDFDIALFSAGAAVSRKYAPLAAKQDCVVIDNSSAWRMDEDIPLVVPEVNPDALNGHRNIIANPNCSTIQLVVVLNRIHKKYGLKRLVVDTYQSISGGGQKMIERLLNESYGMSETEDDSHKLANNAVFHSFKGESGLTVEEHKMINETRKILKLPDLRISVTCVRLPILGGHGEAVNIETEIPVDVEELREDLDGNDGIRVIDKPERNMYPTPHMVENTDEVYVGRIRKDDSVAAGVNLWIVADNIRKGAATNTVQIAELIAK